MSFRLSRMAVVAAGLAALGAAWWWWPFERDAPPARAAANRAPGSSIAAGVAPESSPANAQPPVPEVATKAEVRTPARQAARTAMESFAEWTQRYLDAGPAERPALEAEGVGLATARRPIFHEMIRTDPRQAITEAVPMVVRQALPAGIVSLLEERVADRAEMRLYGASPEAVENGEPSFLRYVETKGGKTYEAHVYGRRESVMRQLPDVSINGVAIDGDLAVSESPLRRLEVGEAPDPAKPRIEVCPISGKSTAIEGAAAEPIAATVAAVEVFEQVVYLCDGAHIVPYEQSLILGEASSGGAQSFTGAMPAAAVPSVGVVKVLYVPVVFADQGQVPASEATCHDVLRQVADFYQTQSFGRLTLVATVTPPVRLPRNQAWYKGKDTTDGYVKEVDCLNAEMTHAKEAARALGYDWQDYHCFVLRDNGGARYPTSFGSIGSGQVWMRNDSFSTVAHEVGHAFGLTHANFWLTNGASVAGPGGNEEYGDIYDNMGTGSPPTAHYNAQAKNQIRWLPDEFAPPITLSGQYRIHAFDTPRIDSGKLYGLRIVKDAERTYWGEYRTLYPSNVWVSNGLLLGWKWSQNSGSNIQLLDTTPGSINGKNDAPLALGSTFSDFESGIHITTLAVNAATSPPSLDVQVNLGDFPGNQPPVLSLNTAALVAPTNSPVSLTATASDPDGDTLAYSWRWHDGVVSPNSPTVSRTFATSGIYTVSCVASDMKGGVAVRNAVITIGTGGSKYTISGRITEDGLGLAGINVTTSGTNGTLTDSDGYYTISNLAAGTYTVTPAAHGYQFNEAFNNSVTVGPSFSGADFEVDALPVVSLTAPAPVAIEGSSPGTFRFTRTGATGLPLTVNTLVVRGTALKTTDYSFSPDYVAISATPYYAFTIPADQSFLDVTVTPVNDVVAEGNETVQLVLGLDAAYLNGTPATATVTIQDDDTSLPRVSLTASQPQIGEGSGGSITCTVTRSGPTAGALSVPYSLPVTNTATAGVDFASLSGSATIPAGSASATFLVTPIDDGTAEATETVGLTIATGAAFIADAAASSVTLRIVDNDTEVVSLATLDANATEVDRAAPGAVPDPGLFMVTRTGDTSQSLTIYYGVAGSALHGVDYEPLPGSITLGAGETQGIITIMPRPDELGEAPETVTLNLAAGNGGYQLGTVSSGTITIADGGGKPILEVMPSSAIAEEPSVNGTFRITAKGTGTATIPVNYTVSGTATAGSDYTALSGTTTVTLNNGVATRDITVSILDDAVAEDMETIVLTLTPSADYTLWDQTQSATMLLRDNDQPTVFADPQVGTGFNQFVAETATTTACKFWISRTGATTAALTVNYSLVGTATNGVDHTTLSGTAVIPAGAPGVDVTFNTINDTSFEGTETVTLHLQPGAYARGPDATLYINDDEAGSQSVAFADSGGSGSESQTTVNIPVVLSAPATTPVSVDYALETGARTTTGLFGLWVRVVRTGTSFESYLSSDGINFAKTSFTRTISMGSTSYLAGIAVSSASSGTLASVRVDNVSVTGLSAGGSAGDVTMADLSGSLPAGGQSGSAGSYIVTSGGPDISLTGTSDGGRMIWIPISNSANCTVTARVMDMTCTNSSVKAGAMIRETTATNSRHFTYIVDTNGATRQIYRTTAGSSATSASIGAPTFAKPRWLRLQRTGNAFSAATSSDGIAFTALGDAQMLPLSSNVIAGLAVSARSDGLLAQGVFDSVSLSTGGSFSTGTVGYVSEPGSATVDAGVYTITGSGAGIMPNYSSVEDECQLVSAPVSGDFTLTARVVSLTGGNAAAQAGLMVRESVSYRARAIWLGLTGSGSSGAEFRSRISATTFGEGAGIDYSLAPGVLNFGIGEQTKNIVLNVHNDLLPEPVEFVTVALKYPYAAVLGTPSTYTYAILDDDGSSNTAPAIGFGSTTSQASETASPALIPVALTEPSSAQVSVNYNITAGGSATGGGVDYSNIAGTLTFSPGETLKFLSLPITNDAAIESTETVVLSLSSPTNAVLSSSTTHTLSIMDDDSPVVTVAATDPNANEAGDTGAFTFYRTGNTSSPLTVNFTRTGTATSGSDFTAFSPSTSITIPSGAASAVLLVSPLQNTSPEVPETVIVTLTTGSYTLGSANAATVIIDDDDVNTVTLTATDPIASEAGSNPGEFTLTRAGPTTASLNVTVSITGTATSGLDFTAISTSRSFSAGQSVITIPVTVLPDTLTEGNEEIVMSISTSSTYVVGSPSVANVTIIDDDLPPTVFVSSPSSKSTIIDPSNGIMLTATGSDDGLPNALVYSWSRIFGPGAVAFGNAAAASTTATFAAAGVYGLRVTVDDGQFTATDDIIIQAGGFQYADWVGMDEGPPGVRGISGESEGVFTLIGSGTGYSTAADSGHMMFRQLIGGSGDCTIITRLSGLTGTSTRLAGITVRDTSWKGARRVNLLLDGAGTLQFRTRTTQNATDTNTTVSGLSLSRWLKLERVGSTITASHADDAGGAPGSWIEIGSATVALSSDPCVGMVVSAGASTPATATATFDHVSVTPAFTGTALHSENLGNYVLAGSSSELNGTVTINAVGTQDSAGGHFRYQQVWGDCVITARLLSHSGVTRGAQSGVSIRDTTDNGPFGFFGTTTIDGFQAHWRSSTGGATGTLQTGGSTGNWIRLIRKGNNVSAFRAIDSGGAPGTWAQMTGNLPAPMTGPMLVGLLVDSNSSSLTATGTFSGLTIAPLNTAPVIDPGTLAELPPFELNANVTDDAKPNPPGAVTTQWTQLAGPGTALIGDAGALQTSMSLDQSGPYVLRLTADDGEAKTFSDLGFTGYLNSFARWRDQQFTNGLTNPAAAADADPDQDGLTNFMEYALVTGPNAASASPVVKDTETIGGQQYLRLTVPKNPSAPDLQYVVEVTGNLSDPLSWTTSGLVIEQDNATTLRVRDSVPISGGGRRFMHVWVYFP